MTKEQRAIPIRALARTIIAYATLAIASWFGVPELGNLIRMDLAFIRGAIIPFFALMLAADLIRILGGRELTGEISTFLKSMAYVIGFYLILIAWLSGNPITMKLPLSFLMSATVICIYLSLHRYLDKKSPIVLNACLKIVVMIVVALNIIATADSLGLEHLEVHLVSILKGGFALTIVSVLIGVFKGSGNIILRAIGRLFTNEGLWFILGAFMVYYVIDIRPHVLAFTYYVEIGEWAVLCLVAIGSYLKLREYIVPEIRDLQLAEWRKHIQVIDMKKDSNFEEVVGLIDSFVQQSKKVPLTVYLTYMLAMRSIPRVDAEKALANIIDYTDPRMDMPIFVWDVNYVSAEARSNRLRVIGEVLRLTDQVMYTRPIEAR